MANYGYYGAIGNLDGGSGTQQPERKYVIVQSLWTKPITDRDRMRKMLFITALSLCYAHRSGYKVHMHTDSKGYDLLKDFGYEGLYKTLDQIPASVPSELFAAGKFYAMIEEGGVGKVHIDVDVMLKQPVLDLFYKDKRIDLICQHEEGDSSIDAHKSKVKNMHVIGYPVGTRPNWHGSINTGVVGFNNPNLAAKYISNYFEALEMYDAEQFEAYKEENGLEKWDIAFDFILEQITLSYMSIGYNVHSLVPSDYADASIVADKIGYTHLQGDGKWTSATQTKIRTDLRDMDKRLYNAVISATHRIKV